MKRDHNYQNIQDMINYECIIITNCFNLLESKLDKMKPAEIVSLVSKMQSTHHNVIRSFYSNYKSSFSIFRDNRFLSEKMSPKNFDESLAAIYTGVMEGFVKKFNEMIEKGQSTGSRLKKEEEFCYIGCLANDFLSEMRKNINFLISQGLNFELVNCDFVLDEEIVELVKSYRHCGFSDNEIEKNLDFLKKEFSFKKF